MSCVGLAAAFTAASIAAVASVSISVDSSSSLSFVSSPPPPLQLQQPSRSGSPLGGRSGGGERAAGVCSGCASAHLLLLHRHPRRLGRSGCASVVLSPPPPALPPGPQRLREQSCYACVHRSSSARLCSSG